MARIFRYQIAAAIGLLVLCLPLFGQAADADSASPILPVLVYNPARVPADVLGSAIEEAARIFRHAGISTRWLDCSETALVCRQLAGPETLVVRIVPKAEALPDHNVFGISYLSADGSGTYSTVFYDRVQRMHAEWHTNLPGLLGHVAAHELGHLLLGSNAHARMGIMGARWHAPELRQLAMGRLLFTADQAASLRTRLLTRTKAGRLVGVRDGSPGL